MRCLKCQRKRVKTLAHLSNLVSLCMIRMRYLDEKHDISDLDVFVVLEGV
jgi:hypothetical protein